jgi:hypothetical protein
MILFVVLIGINQTLVVIPASEMNIILFLRFAYECLVISDQTLKLRYTTWLFTSSKTQGLAIAPWFLTG